MTKSGTRDNSTSKTAHILTISAEKKIEDISYLGTHLFGWEKDQIQDKGFVDIFAHKSVTNHENHLNSLLGSKSMTRAESLADKEGHIHTYHLVVAPVDDKGWKINIDNSATSGLQHLLKEKVISRMLLRTHLAESLEELIRGSSLMLKEYSGADAVGLRLKRGTEFPYYEVSGFSEEFVTGEDSICRTGNHEADGKGVYECLCGCVLEQRRIDKLRGFTSFGSYYTNNTNELIKEMPAFGENLIVRGKCLYDGFLSVALIPLRLRGQVHGLIQLNSFDTDAFSDDLIEAVQEIANQLVIAIDNFNQREELQLLNNKLIASNERLRKINHELNMFAGEVTHDLRSPLIRIKQYVDLLELEIKEPLSEKSRLYFDRLKNVVPQMQEMVTSFIALTKISESSLSKNEVNLSQMVTNAVEAAKTEFPDAEIEVEIKEDVEAMTDTGLIQIVVSNLINNAVKYCSAKVPGHISFGQTEKNNEQVYYVADNGIGMNADEMDYLFKPFKRLSNAKDFSGNGIGLSSVKRAVERLGGRIWCESTLGVGTTFYFTLN